MAGIIQKVGLKVDECLSTSLCIIVNINQNNESEKEASLGMR